MACLDQQRLQASLRQVGGRHQAVVSTPDHDCVEVGSRHVHHSAGRFVKRGYRFRVIAHIRRFADLTGPQVAELLTDTTILVQPLGAIEQHGPHLPLSTDSVVATAVAIISAKLSGFQSLGSSDR